MTKLCFAPFLLAVEKQHAKVSSFTRNFFQTQCVFDTNDGSSRSQDSEPQEIASVSSCLPMAIKVGYFVLHNVFSVYICDGMCKLQPELLHRDLVSGEERRHWPMLKWSCVRCRWFPCQTQRPKTIFYPRTQHHHGTRRENRAPVRCDAKGNLTTWKLAHSTRMSFRMNEVWLFAGENDHNTD